MIVTIDQDTGIDAGDLVAGHPSGEGTGIETAILVIARPTAIAVP